MNIFVGLCMMVMAFLVVKYRLAIYNFTGSFSWIEQYLGGGSTILVIAAFGVFLFFAGITHMTGNTGPILRGMFGGIFGLGA